MNRSPSSIVGIGASAGGIQAFRRFFENMLPDTGLGFIVVLHLATGRKSMLAEILARWTSMPVTEAQDDDAIEANHVYVIPPGVVATLRAGRLSLRQLLNGSPREASPIDILFDSMATSLSENAIGIVLSGTGHDGALGLKAIKTRGGLTLAQGSDGSAPEYAGMPDSAVAAGAVDLFVPVDQMPGHILTVLTVRPPPTTSLDKIRLEICEILRSQIGHDFSHYKEQTFMRRVQRRMQVLRLTELDDYKQRLRTDREQIVLLFRDLLISVTSFFRDAPTFEVLEKAIIPRLFNGKDAGGQVRVWVPGCATGEEAYSLAILLREHMDTLSAKPKVQVFASDIDEFGDRHGTRWTLSRHLVERHGSRPEGTIFR